VGLPSIFCPGTQLLRSWLMNFQLAAEDHRASPQSASTPLAPDSYDPFSFFRHSERSKESLFSAPDCR
jgi:hypothetical protein